MATRTQAIEEVASLWANYWLSERLDEEATAA